MALRTGTYRITIGSFDNEEHSESPQWRIRLERKKNYVGILKLNWDSRNDHLNYATHKILSWLVSQPELKVFKTSTIGEHAVEVHEEKMKTKGDNVELNVKLTREEISELWKKTVNEYMGTKVGPEFHIMGDPKMLPDGRLDITMTSESTLRKERLLRSVVASPMGRQSKHAAVYTCIAEYLKNRSSLGKEIADHVKTVLPEVPRNIVQATLFNMKMRGNVKVVDDSVGKGSWLYTLSTGAGTLGDRIGTK